MTVARKDSYIYWTKPYSAGDGRLKMLWIEDRPDDILPRVTRAIEEWFAIICVKGPRELKQLIEDTSPENHVPDGDGTVYALGGVPCDTYLTDFRLCDKRDEGCTVEEHVRIGLHAPSGGFLLGMLTALHWPKHPQSIIPYSAYSEEFGQIWRLSSAVFPPTVNVLWDEAVGKGSRDQSRLIKLIAPEYRKALQIGFGAGLVHMPLTERDRWEDLLGGSADAISARERLWIVGEYGARPILAGALFYDSLMPGSDPQVPTSVIREWFADVPVVCPMEKEARLVAECYWELRCSPLSQMIYRMIQQVKLGVTIPDLQASPPGFPSLFALKRGDDGERLVRLAFLFLLIREHHKRKIADPRPSADREDQLSDVARNYVKALKRYGSLEEMLKAMLQVAVDTGTTDEFDAFLDEIREHRTIKGLRLFDEGLGDDYAEATGQVHLAVSEAAVVHLVDPLPTKWDQPLSLDKGKGVGKAVARLWSDNEKDLYDVRELLKGDDSRLTPTEKLCARRFARELMPSERDWPPWLAGTR